MKHMKRTRWGALLLAILMLANAMASGVMTVFAEDEITPVLLIDGGSLNPVSGYNCTGEYDYEAGYITLTATGDDPYYSFNMIKADANGGTVVGPYLSIKYRVDAKYAGMQGEFFASTNYHHAGQVEDGSDKFRFDYECDGEWHIEVIYLPDVMGEHYNLESNTLNFFRNDFIYAAANGYCVDVEYYAFFDSLSDAEEYVHPLPEMVGDGSTKTIDFAPMTLDEQKALFGDNWVDVRMEEGMGYATFVATGKDPYLVLAGDSDRKIGIKGYEASYILVKYQTSANSQTTTKIEFYTNIEFGPQWGGDGSHAEADLINDGQWQYVLVDATASFGTFFTDLYAFKVDPLAVAVPGDSINIELIKFFPQKSLAERYINNMAEQGDEAAALYVERNKPCEHEETEVIPGKAPTCIKSGKTEGAVCRKCGETVIKQTTIPALGHTEEEIPAVEPTCIEYGWTDGVKCVTCDTILVTQMVVPATGHSFSRIVKQVLTCTVDGIEERTCSACGLTETHIEYARGHKIGDPVTVVEPTCTEGGVRYLPCMVCGKALLNEYSPALGHQMGDPVTVVAPTCTETGSQRFPCARCDCTLKTEEIPATGHSFGEWSVTDPTCATNGAKERTCACGEIETEIIPALGHTFGEWKVIVQATETTRGIKVRACACGEIESAEIPVLATSEEPNYVLGDVNGDGAVNVKDLTRLKKCLAGAEELSSVEAADVTVDGDVNGKDLTRLKRYLAGTAELG